MKQKSFLMPAVLLIAISSSVSFAQEEKIVSETNLVTVNVIVTDNQGRYVKGLKQSQFDVYDEKVKQQITHFSTEEGPSRSALFVRFTTRVRKRHGRY